MRERWLTSDTSTFHHDIKKQDVISKESTFLQEAYYQQSVINNSREKFDQN